MSLVDKMLLLTDCGSYLKWNVEVTGLSRAKTPRVESGNGNGVQAIICGQDHS